MRKCDMRLGLGSYALAWAAGVPGYPPPARPLDVFGLLEAAREAGASLVQVCDNLPLHDQPPALLDRLRGEAASAGIALEIGTRGTDPGMLERYLGIARALHAGLVRTLIPDRGRPALEEAERSLRIVLPRFEEAGVRLAIENYQNQSVIDLAGLIRRIDSLHLGVCLDTVNSFGALEAPSLAQRELLPLAASIHVKDFDIGRVDHGMGYLLEGRPAGEGRLDIDGLLAGARSSGRQPSIVLELWTPWQGSIEATVALERAWARQSMSHLGRIVP
jgi:3-oxoisoapionate decarboxylase